LVVAFSAHPAAHIWTYFDLLRVSMRIFYV
jgi:hypothetical protein